MSCTLCVRPEGPDPGQQDRQLHLLGAERHRAVRQPGRQLVPAGQEQLLDVGLAQVHRPVRRERPPGTWSAGHRPGSDGSPAPRRPPTPARSRRTPRGAAWRRATRGCRWWSTGAARRERPARCRPPTRPGRPGRANRARSARPAGAQPCRWAGRCVGSSAAGRVPHAACAPGRRHGGRGEAGVHRRGQLPRSSGRTASARSTMPATTGPCWSRTRSNPRAEPLSRLSMTGLPRRGGVSVARRVHSARVAGPVTTPSAHSPSGTVPGRTRSVIFAGGSGWWCRGVGAPHRAPRRAWEDGARDGPHPGRQGDGWPPSRPS